jgi:hypothetical protein
VIRSSVIADASIPKTAACNLAAGNKPLGVRETMDAIPKSKKGLQIKRLSSKMVARRPTEAGAGRM